MAHFDYLTSVAYTTHFRAKPLLLGESLQKGTLYYDVDTITGAHWRDEADPLALVIAEFGGCKRENGSICSEAGRALQVLRYATKAHMKRRTPFALCPECWAAIKPERMRMICDFECVHCGWAPDDTNAGQPLMVVEEGDEARLPALDAMRTSQHGARWQPCHREYRGPMPQSLQEQIRLRDFNKR